jgi:hypothetical protein
VPPRHGATDDISTGPSTAAFGIPAMDEQAREYLGRIIYTPEEVGRWIKGDYYLDIYDPLMGWIHHKDHIPSGVDGSYASNSYDPNGARHMIQYADKPYRMNTYGNSFTHCDQVNDGETWQEYLAAHLCEPVRNWGLSGHSVYQMYVRMKEEEPRQPGQCIIVNIYSDDHYRSVYGWPAIPIGVHPAEILRGAHRRPPMPWVEVNPVTGKFIEHPNLCPRPEDLDRLCDPDFVVKQFRDDMVLRAYIGRRNLKFDMPEYSYDNIRELGLEHGLDLDISSAESLTSAIDRIYKAASIYASKRIVGMMEGLAADQGSKILYVLSYTSQDLVYALEGNERIDREFVDFLEAEGLPYVDLLEEHREEYEQFRGTAKEYSKRYYIGHYKPIGNLFTAFAIKDKLMSKLDPKPSSYIPLPN